MKYQLLVRFYLLNFQLNFRLSDPFSLKTWELKKILHFVEIKNEVKRLSNVYDEAKNTRFFIIVNFL
jgi:hypothetical protein